jgi:DNA-binding transcriptional ArsR family regulator
MQEEYKLQIIFQTLGDTNRIRVLRFIGNEKRSVNEIVHKTGLSQPLVSHHLKVMKKSEILDTNRVGPFIYYRLKYPAILEAVEMFSDIAKKMEF